MTGLYLNEPALLILQAGAWLGCGGLIGVLQFTMLQWNIRLFVAGGPWLPAMLLQLGRLALLAVALSLVTERFGVFPLLMTTAGVLVTRVAALRIGVRT
jgi:hypothetical protein